MKLYEIKFNSNNVNPPDFAYYSLFYLEYNGYRSTFQSTINLVFSEYNKSNKKVPKKYKGYTDMDKLILLGEIDYDSSRPIKEQFKEQCPEIFI